MKKFNTHTTSITQSSDTQVKAREELWDYFIEGSMPDAEKERNLGLYIRSQNLARILTISAIYQKIKHLPGSIMDYGTWRGQNFILCENLRAIYEPFNKQRKIFAFDTFEGYYSSDPADQSDNSSFHNGQYSTGNDYDQSLLKLMNIHESNNILSNVKSDHQIIKGDILNTLPTFLQEQKNLLVALAFFDMNLEEPTSFALEKTLEHSMPGTHLVFMQLQRDFLPGEGISYINKILGKRKHSIHLAAEYPSITIIEIL